MSYLKSLQDRQASFREKCQQQYNHNQLSQGVYHPPSTSTIYQLKPSITCLTQRHLHRPVPFENYGMSQRPQYSNLNSPVTPPTTSFDESQIPFSIDTDTTNMSSSTSLPPVSGQQINHHNITTREDLVDIGEHIKSFILSPIILFVEYVDRLNFSHFIKDCVFFLFAMAYSEIIDSICKNYLDIQSKVLKFGIKLFILLTVLKIITDHAKKHYKCLKPNEELSNKTYISQQPSYSSNQYPRIFGV